MEDVVQALQERIDNKKDSIKEITCKLAALRKSVKVKHPGDDTGQLEDVQLNSAIPDASVRATIDEAYDVLERQMLESITWPNKSSSGK